MLYHELHWGGTGPKFSLGAVAPLEQALVTDHIKCRQHTTY